MRPPQKPGREAGFSIDRLAALPLIMAILHPIRMQLSDIQIPYMPKTTDRHATRTARPVDAPNSCAAAIGAPRDSYGFIMRRRLNTGRGVAPAPAKTCGAWRRRSESPCLRRRMAGTTVAAFAVDPGDGRITSLSRLGLPAMMKPTMDAASSAGAIAYG
jgi:hypothetical protein